MAVGSRGPSRESPGAQGLGLEASWGSKGCEDWLLRSPGLAGDGDQSESLNEGTRVPDPARSDRGKEAAPGACAAAGTETAARPESAPSPRRDLGEPAAPAGSLAGGVVTSVRSGPAPCLHLLQLLVLVEQGSAEDGERLLRVRQLPHDQVDADRIPGLQRQDKAEDA